jgi:hypothetical protein
LELSPDSSLLVEASDLLEDGKDYYLAGYCCCALAEALGEPGEADGLFERAIANFRKTDSQLGVPNALQRWAKQELSGAEHESWACAPCVKTGFEKCFPGSPRSTKWHQLRLEMSVDGNSGR